MPIATLPRVLGTLLTLSSLSALTGCDDPVVMQDNRHARRTYREQTILWLNWALGLPHSTSSPIADETGAACALGQGDKMWYLAGTFGGAVERDCTIPRNHHLFFPLINLWGVNQGTSVDDEVAQAPFIAFFETYFPARRASTCELTLRLDGEDMLGDELENLDEALYVEILDPFEVDVNADNYTEGGLAGGIQPMLSNGHFALLRPLEPGEHVLELGGSICDGEAVEFETFVTYNLTVLP